MGREALIPRRAKYRIFVGLVLFAGLGLLLWFGAGPSALNRLLPGPLRLSAPPSQPPGPIVVRVTDPAGRPIRGAVLDLGGFPAAADRDGWIHIPPIFVEAVRWEEARLSRYGFAARTIPRPEFLGNWNFVLEPLPVRSRILVRILDVTSGEPVRGAPLVFRIVGQNQEGRFAAEENEEGLAVVPVYTDEALIFELHSGAPDRVLVPPSKQYRFADLAEGEERRLDVHVRPAR